MPIHLPISRRSFLAGTTSALFLSRFSLGEDAKEKKQVDPNMFCLFSDTHVPSKPSESSRGVNMTDNFRKAVGQAASLAPVPAGVIMCGDLAYLRGLETDYKQFAPIVRKLPEAQVPAHLVLGNHDNREVFYSVLKEHKPEKQVVENKHVSIVESPHANWFLLDSLEITNATPGLLGEKQLNWLSEALDAHADKPAIVMSHHDLHIIPEGKKPTVGSGLKDTDALLKVLLPRKHVKAYVNGHRHFSKHWVHEGLCVIELPAVAYVFSKSQTSSWVLAQLKKDGIALTQKCLDSAHADHGKKVELSWQR